MKKPLKNQFIRRVQKETNKAINVAKSLPAIGLKTSSDIIKFSISYSVSEMFSTHRDKAQYRSYKIEPLGNLAKVTADNSIGKVALTFSNATLEVSTLCPDLLKVSWYSGGTPRHSYATEGSISSLTKDKKSSKTKGSTGIETKERSVTLATDKMSVTVGNDGSVRIDDLEGKTVWEGRPPVKKGNGWIHRGRLRLEERIYGLGERAGALNLRGSTYSLYNLDPGGSYGRGKDPLYMTIPVYIGLHREGSYLVFHDNPSRGKVRIQNRLEAEFQSGDLTSYIAIGPPERLLELYTSLTGRSPMPPLWALGYHQSRWGYATEADIKEVAYKFVENDIPLSAIHLDIDYMNRYEVFTIDKNKFPDMRTLSKELFDKGIKLVAIVDCGVKADEEFALYEEGLKDDLFCRLRNGKLSLGGVWPGVCAFPDFTKPETRKWWGSHYKDLVEEGISGIWHDMNEPTCITNLLKERTLFPSTYHSFEGQGATHIEAHNVYPLLENKAAFEAWARDYPDRRLFMLTRSGWAGIQRYSWHWTGDLNSSWEELYQTIATVVGLGLSGVPFSGADIGGFSANPSPELYIRWLQAAVFMPFCRTHSSYGTARREPWYFSDQELTRIRETIKLRYRLLPYLYTLTFETHTKGTPLVRPIWWIDPTDAELWDIDDCFMLGNDLLVAPLVESGAQTKIVNLPKGCWYDLFEELDRPSSNIDNAIITGPKSIGLSAVDEHIPVLARGGSIIPLSVSKDLPDSEKWSIQLHIFADQSNKAHGELFSDDGEGYGRWTKEEFSMASTNTGKTLKKVSGKTQYLKLTRQATHGIHTSPIKASSQDADKNNQTSKTLSKTQLRERSPKIYSVILHGIAAKAVSADGESLHLEGNHFEVGGDFLEITIET